jgi:hypothetical protein
VTAEKPDATSGIANGTNGRADAATGKANAAIGRPDAKMGRANGAVGRADAAKRAANATQLNRMPTLVASFRVKTQRLDLFALRIDHPNLASPGA